MSRKVKPLDVSLVIRSARYICLFSGIVFGVTKFEAFKAYEKTVREARKKRYREKLHREYIEKKLADERAIEEVIADVMK